MRAGAPACGGHPDPPTCGAASGHPLLLLAVLGLLSIPVARGDCGPPPAMTHSRPSSDEHPSSFPVGSRVTFTCAEGARKIPGLPDTTECLPGNLWSRLLDPCGRSCAAPTRLRFAALSKEDERRNFFPVGTNVSYVCRPGYENTSESSPSSTCLENLAWSEAAELCRRRSCGAPGALPGGRMGPLTDLQLGARVDVFCEDGYKVVGNNFIRCQLKGNDVEWSELPTCELITCPPPPPISHGRHDREGIEIFAFNSTVTYSCDPNFQLVGNGSIRCTSRDKTSGAWSGAAPQCKEKSSAVRLGAQDMERTAPPKSPQGNGIQPSKKTSMWEMKLSLYQKALQNTISFSQSSSFFRKPVSRSWAASEFRFVLPLYKSPKSYFGTSKGFMCPPKYMGILPQPGCFQNLKWSKAASFHGRRSWVARRSWTRRRCCSSRFPTCCKG
ncbi:complement decay-accelerating factor [Corvus cornix cornix]|uniref:complement decay-accelerating factor n=1 Tax=Corvus cornix cornix TaxID=932674 RepID=UPI001952781E|nr:complement decay-accelerating factor [Corvus cornix cornix]XP_019144446.2 complement decay-accelerating factor [Corvus cornix cornix]